MSFRCTLTFFFILNIALSIVGINHWVLNENGKITQKIDSPFYMREPSNLIAFLEQIVHTEIVEDLYKELLRQRELTVERINFSIKYGLAVLQEVKCGLQYFQLENAITSTKLTEKYLKRVSVKNKSDKAPPNPIPLCSAHSDLKEGISTYNHLPSLNVDRIKIFIEPEEEFGNIHTEFESEKYIQSLSAGLIENPNSWKYYTLSSYFWRMKGNAHEALECVLRALMFAPREFKDIPLLSLGSILFRSEQWQDAQVILTAALDHAPEIPENHFALAIVLGMNVHLNRSLEHFEIVEKLEPSFIETTQHLKSFVSCTTGLKSKINEINDNIEYIKKEVVNLKMIKNKIVSSLERLVAQQVPLGSRHFDSNIDELRQRGQYCSTRTLAGTEEPVLFCDFYSDLQMRLESREVDIDSFENEMKSRSEAILKQMSKDYYNQFTSRNYRTY